MLDEKQLTGDHSIPYVRNVDVQWDYVNVNELPELDIKPHEFARFTLKPGDLLICEGGEVGRTAIWRGELEQCAFQKAIHRLRPLSSNEYIRYFYYCMLFAAATEVFLAQGNPNTIPHLTGEKLRRYRFPTPPLSEQITIAAFLDCETAKIDALVAEQRRLIELLKEKRQAVISHAVTKGLNPDAPMKPSGIEWLGDVPAHWEVSSLSSLITKITNGYVGPTRDILVDEGVRYLQSLHIKENQIRFDSPYYVSREWSDDHAKSILQVGDVLIVQTGDIGQVAVVTDEFAGCNCHALIIVTPKSECVSGEWISWLLNSDYGLHSLLSIQTGALHPHLNCGNVKYIQIPVPPLNEQPEIVEHVTQRLFEFDDLIRHSQHAIGLLQERRTALISAAVTGKIDVRGLAQTEAA
jgi:type I restriction enzyme S subunit